RAVSLANIEAAFGDSFSAADRKRIARESYQHFARAMFDLFWASRLRRENFRDYTRLENFDRAFAPAVTERGSITITVHLGSFEWMLISMGLWGHMGLGVTEGFKNPLLTEIFK